MGKSVNLQQEKCLDKFQTAALRKEVTIAYIAIYVHAYIPMQFANGKSCGYKNIKCLRICM